MSEYLVLARKYRPQRFEDLVGQDVLVRTLTNAIATQRIVHAFVLTGIRGIGKTTTARIMAKALNCLGGDGTLQSATATPCGVCANCVQITEGRHVDVMEMDAASRTGVDGVREIIDAVHYRPTSARYKVYIIDEAHMLSNNAFNALLKTLEEPPAHSIFIFATTEIRKVPVTILSRCQRFDLRRLTNQEMVAHLSKICECEKVEAVDDALELVAIAAEGSVRDALSLLDQAIAHSKQGDDGQYRVGAETVRGLLGLVDRAKLYLMLEHLFSGQCREALAELEAQYRDGANMPNLVTDMMGAVHIVSRLLVASDYALDHSFAPHEKDMLTRLASTLSIPAAARAWQLLTKGLEEIKTSPNALNATEMLFIRFAYTAHMPDPATIIRQWKEGNAATPAIPKPPGGGGGAHATLVHTAPFTQNTQLAQKIEPVLHTPHLALATYHPDVTLKRFEDVLELLEQQKEQILLYHVMQQIRVVACAGQELVISKNSMPEPETLNRLRELLKRMRGWSIRLSDEAGAPTIAEQKEAQRRLRWEAAKNHPLVVSILETFEGAAMVAVEPEQP